MKEFNQWWEKRRGKIYHNDITSIVEETWKAALEWALEQEKWQGTDYYGGWGVSRLDIEGELNGVEE